MRTVLTIALLSAVALSAPAPAQTVGAVPIQYEGTILDVTAEGRTTRVPDVATIRAGVVTQGATAAAALADNSAKMARVLAAIRRAGVAARDVQTSNVGLSPQYRYVENQAPVVTGYQANNSVAIRFRDIARSGAILDVLVAEGANQIDGPNLSIDNPDTALDEARADAVKRARARAELYARAAGLSVVRIVSIAEAGENRGGPNPPVLYAMRQSRGESADTAVVAGERDVTASVAVRFLLK
ncbi:MAG: SIMPL domain-containing protein [Pseudomonadota bacterium]